MTSKKKQTNIGDALSSIDSLLNTATIVNLESSDEIQSTPSEDSSTKVKKNNPAKTTTKHSQRESQLNKAEINEIIDQTQKSTENKTKQKPVTKGNNPAKTKIDEKNTKWISEEPIDEKNINETTKKANLENNKITDDESKPAITADKKLKEIEPPTEKLSFNSLEDDLSTLHEPLPLLNDIITPEELVLIASGKTIQKREITETFKQETTPDKIIDLLSIQLADYNITRLEFEYLHDLIENIITEDIKSPKK